MKHTSKKKKVKRKYFRKKNYDNNKNLEMKERGELKGARDQGRWIKVLTWELQEVRSYSSISCSYNNNN